MKAFVWLALVCAVSFSCRKNNVSAVDQQLTGKWELRESSGGIAGTIKYNPGNGIVLNFYDNKTYRFLFPGTPTRTGTYEIRKAANLRDWILGLRYESNGQPRVETDSIRLENNQLIFLPAESCCDFPSIIYERQ